MEPSDTQWSQLPCPATFYRTLVLPCGDAIIDFMARCLRVLLTAVLMLALAASGMVIRAGAPAAAATVPLQGSFVVVDHGKCPTCQVSPVVAAITHHCASSCPSLIGTMPDAMTFDVSMRSLPPPGPGVAVTGRLTSPDPIPPRP